MDLVHKPTVEPVYAKNDGLVIFNQLGVKIEMDSVTNDEYYRWLDEMTARIGSLVPGSQIVEKDHARSSPPLNTAIYYDTPDYQVLPTGALLRTSCNKITHAFCAFKVAQDDNHVRRDHRYVFDGVEKRVIQHAPASPEAVSIVRRLLTRTDVINPGTHLQDHYGIRAMDLIPAIRLDDLRYTFFVWLDQRDALRCSIDRYRVSDLRLPETSQTEKPLSEVELSIYPRIEPEVATDPRVVALISSLSTSLTARFGVSVTTDIKYQRSARALGVGAG